MTILDPFPLTRKQIASFVGNEHEKIRRIERLFEVAGEILPGLIDGNGIAGGNALALVQSLTAVFEVFVDDTGSNLSMTDSRISAMSETQKEINDLEFYMQAINQGGGTY